MMKQRKKLHRSWRCSLFLLLLLALSLLAAGCAQSGGKPENAPAGTVASLHMAGEETRYFSSMEEALAAAATCTEEDEAVIRLRSPIYLEEDWLSVEAGRFSIDLNGRHIHSQNKEHAALELGPEAHLSIGDESEGGSGEISGAFAAVQNNGGHLNLRGGRFRGEDFGIRAHNSAVNILGGLINGEIGVYEESSILRMREGSVNGEKIGIHSLSQVHIQGGSISGEDGILIEDGLVAVSGGEVFASRCAIRSLGKRAAMSLSGGSIGGGECDLWNESGSILLIRPGKGETGVCFPGGLTVEGSALSSILDLAAAYWQDGRQLDAETEADSIAEGDVCVRRACNHEENSNGKGRDNGDSSHSIRCSFCSQEFTEAHSRYSEAGLCESCQAPAVASLHRRAGEIAYYGELGEAVRAAVDCGPGADALLTLLADIDQEGSYQKIGSGDFTIDLNGKKLHSRSIHHGALCINGPDAELRILDSSREQSGEISGAFAAVELQGGTVDIRGGRLSGEQSGLYAQEGSVYLRGGEISGKAEALLSHKSLLNLDGGSLHSSGSAISAYESRLNLRSGELSGEGCDLRDVGGSSIRLLCPAEGKQGMRFPGGLVVEGSSLPGLLGEGAVFWQGETPLFPEEDAKSISGDVWVSAACKHEKNSNRNGRDAGDGSHSLICSFCSQEFTEAHSSYDETGRCVICRSAAVASLRRGSGELSHYGELGAAIAVVKNCGAEDKALLTLLADIDLGEEIQKLESGVFTLDLNGKQIRSGNKSWGAFFLNGPELELCIKDSSKEKSGQLSGSHAAIHLYQGSLRLEDGLLSGQAGIYLFDGGTAQINSGRISGEDYAIFSYNDCHIQINGGEISSVADAIYLSVGSLTISGGEISAKNALSLEKSSLRMDGGRLSSTGYAISSYDSSLELCGGEISGEGCDLRDVGGSSIRLLRPAEGKTGVRFPRELVVEGCSLPGLLGEGAVFWQGETPLFPAEEAKSISGGDVCIRPARTE